MQNEIMQMVLESLLEFQESTGDDRFGDCIDGLQAILAKPKRPMTPEQARDLGLGHADALVLHLEHQFNPAQILRLHPRA